MALTDILKEKILKAGSKQKLDSITKYVNQVFALNLPSKSFLLKCQ